MHAERTRFGHQASAIYAYAFQAGYHLVLWVALPSAEGIPVLLSDWKARMFGSTCIVELEATAVACNIEMVKA